MRKMIIGSLICLGLGFAAAQDFDWAELGEATYANCVGCHQANGEGIVGAFPSLAGHLPNVVAKEGGREYIINVLVYGLQGELTVLGDTINSVMPAWGTLSDEQIAAVLNHELHSWGNADSLAEDFVIITPEEVAAQRDQGLSPEDVLGLRAALELGADE